MMTSPSGVAADILQVVPQMAMGGMERGVLETCAAAKAQGLKCLVASVGGPWVEQLKSMGIEHVSVAVNDPSKAGPSVRRLQELIDRSGCRVVHVRSRVPRRLATRLAAERGTDRIPALVHSVHSYRDCRDDPALFSVFQSIVAVSHDLAGRLRQAHPAVAGRISVIPNGVDLDRFRPRFRPKAAWLADFRSRHSIPSDKFVIAMVARLSPWKGQLRFLRILSELARELPQVHGLIVGPTPQANHRAFARKLARRVRWRRMRNVTIAGAETDVRNVYALADLVISLSYDPPETYGRVLMEALASGVPIVGYQHGGACEFAFHLFGEGGVEPLDDRAVIDTIARFVTTPPEVPTIPPEFSLRHTSRQLMQIYRDLGA